MNDQIKSLVSQSITFINLQIARAIRCLRSKDAKGCIILTLARAGSLGDEAILRGLLEACRSNGIGPIVLASAYGDTAGDYSTLLETYPEVRFVSLPERTGGLLAQLKLAWLSRKYAVLSVPGADMLDGFYGVDTTLRKLRLAMIGRKAGMSVGLLAFSFNEQPCTEVIKVMRKFESDVRISARDPISQGRLNRCLARRVELSADLAFLMPPNPGDHRLHPYNHWIADARKQNGKILGISPNVLHANRFYGRAALVTFYAKLIEKIIANNRSTRVILVPHDYRTIEGRPSDFSLCKEIKESVCADRLQNVNFVDTKLGAREIKALCGQMDVLFSGRMHCAIGSLGSATPVVCLDYQGKFEGLLAHFDLPELLIKNLEINDPESTAAYIEQVLQQSDQLRSHIIRRLPSVRRFAEGNLRACAA